MPTFPPSHGTGVLVLPSAKGEDASAAPPIAPAPVVVLSKAEQRKLRQVAQKKERREGISQVGRRGAEDDPHPYAFFPSAGKRA